MKMNQLIGAAMNGRQMAASLMAAIALLAAGRAGAQQIWYGTVSTSWNNPTNWTPSWQIPGNIQSVPAAGASITIPSGDSFYPVVTNNVTLGALAMNQGSGSFTVSGGTLTVGSGGINAAGGSTFTIGSGANLVSTGTFTENGVLTVNGTVTGSLVVYSSANITVGTNGTLNTSSGGLNVNGGGGNLNVYGTVNDAGNDISLNATITVTGGTLTAGNITLNSGTLTVTNGTVNCNGMTFHNGAYVAVSGASTVTSTGIWTYTGGSYSFTSGNFTFGGGSQTLPTGTFSSLNLTGGGTITLSGDSVTGNLSIASGTVASLASGVNVPAGSLTLGGAGQLNGTWGSTASTAAHTNNTYFTGAGYLTVTTNAAAQATTTTLASLPAVSYGSAAIFTATVAPTPTGGTVQFRTNGVAIGSPVTVTGGKAAYTNSTLVAGSYTVTAVYGGNSLFNTSTSASATQVVNPATVTVTSGLTANSKAYTGTTAATISSNNVVLAGVLAGDTANVHISTAGYTATFASANAASGIAVTVSGLTLTGSAAANYSLTQPAGLTANITALPVTVTSGLTANSKAYTGTTAATLSAGSVVLNGVLAGDAANVSLSTNGSTATFASANVANGLTVTVSGLTLTGSAAGNYTLTQPSGFTANITALPVTVTSGITANSKAYTGTTAATISVSSAVLSGVLSGDTANVRLATNGYTATFAGAGAANGVAVTVAGLSLAGSAAANYTLTQPSGFTANITALPVTITSGLTAGNKAYDGATTATLNAGSVVLSGVLSGDTANVHLSTNGYTATFASANVANGVAVTVSGLTLTGSAAANYTLTQPAGLTANITSLAVTVTSGLTVNGKVYNGTTATTLNAGSVVLAGVTSGDTANVHLSTNGYAATFASANVANGITVTVSGLTLTGSAATNYTLTQPSGFTASITAAPVTVTSGLTANGKIYNGTTAATLSANNVVLGGVVAADSANVHLSTAAAGAAFAGANVANGVAVTVTGLTLTGSAAANYSLTQPAGLTANITAATVTVASGLTANNKAYDGTTAATLSANNVVLTGVVTADAADVALSTNGYTAAFAGATPALGVHVTVGGLTLTGSAAGNYTLTQPATLTANITQTTVAITAPGSGQFVTNGNLTVTATGTAAGNTPVAGVWLSLNGGTWTNATTANGWTNWSLALPVTAGAQSLRAYSVDALGNRSVTNTVAFTYAQTAVLTVLTNGFGIVSPADNGLTLPVGAAYSLTATGQNGFAFTNWTSNLLPATNTATLNFTMASNLTVTANFADITPPTLSVLTPVASQVIQTNTGMVTVTGKAADNAAVANVLVSLDGGLWTNATTAGGWTNWSAVLPVTGGAHTLYACAVDAAGNRSATNRTAFTYVPTALMTVIINGNGTVKTNYNGQQLIVGNTYSMTATAATGGSFTGWTGNVAPGQANLFTLNFLMTSNLVVTANFTNVPSPNLTVLSPTNGQPVVGNLGTVSVTGTAVESLRVSNVWVSMDNVTWTNAASNNHFTNWNATLPVTAGAQTLYAYGVDVNGHRSAVTAVPFNFTLTALVIVNLNGNGGVTTNYSYHQLTVGQSYSVTAFNQYGWVFTNWSANLPLTTNQITPTNNPALTFTAVSNLVLTANFYYTNAPTIAITNPVNGQVVTSGTLALQGVAASPGGLGAVWYSLNTNAWQLATGTTNWYASVPLTPGTNLLRAFSAAAYGGYTSFVSTTRVMYAVSAPLTIQTNGLGSVTQPAGGYNIGQNYTLTAVPATGFVFTNWTSNAGPGTNKTQFSFTMVSNLVVAANFADTVSPTVAITSPTSGSTVTNGQLSVTGTAGDNWAVGAVSYQLNGGAWTPVSTANRYTNWNATLTLAPGTNVIKAVAADIGSTVPFGVTRYSTTNSVTVIFQAAPTSLVNTRAMVTLAGSLPVEVDFGSGVFSQYDWGTNNDDAAGAYTATNTDPATIRVTLAAFALPQNTFTQAVQFNFTNRNMAWFTYTNGQGQPETATAVFSQITNATAATFTGQVLATVDAAGVNARSRYISSSQVVVTNGATVLTNSYTYQAYGPCGAVLTTMGGGVTNWTLFHFESVYAAEYSSVSSTGASDEGLAGFVRSTVLGNAPTATAVNGHQLLANNGDTLATVVLNNGLFALTTSDASASGAGAYVYGSVTANTAQLVLNYTVPANTPAVTNSITFINPNFGVATNDGVASGLIVR